MAILYSVIALLIVMIIWAVNQLVAVGFGAPIISSDKVVIEAALKLAEANPGEKFIDLGCGWGKVLTIAGKRGLDTEGIDVSPAAVLWNRLWGRKVRLGDVRKINLRRFDIIYIYLLPRLIKKMRLDDLKPGSRIVAVDFTIQDREYLKTKKIGKHTIYLYMPS